MKPTCVLFDFFGTLVDYNADRTTHAFTRTHALLVSSGVELSLAEMRSCIDSAFARFDQISATNGTEFLMPDVMGDVCMQLGQEGNHQLVADLVAVYLEEWSSSIEEIPGVKTLLQACSKQFTTGLITNTHHTPMIHDQLARLELNGLFDVVMTSADHGKPKPDPSIFTATLAAIGKNPQECIYVGDNFRADYEGAEGAGIACYLIGSHARVPLARQLPSVLDIAQVLRRI